MEPGNKASEMGVAGGAAPEGKVQKVREFRHRAKECRQSAANANNAELRKHYEELATVWERLAKERLDFFVEHPEADKYGEAAADDGDGHHSSSA